MVVNNKTYAYSSTNQLKQVNDSVSGRIVSYDYDQNGNLIKKHDSSLTPAYADSYFDYDSLNRLVQARQGGNILGQYDYNEHNLRIRHKNSERGNIDYYHDGRSIIEERSGTDNSLIARYSYADKLLSLATQNGRQYYHHDALGSTVNLTDQTGATKAGYILDPWGKITGQNGDSVNRQIFTGKEHDKQTGLIYFGARYYDPDTARFINQDDYLGEEEEPPSLHRYLYAYSNPLSFYDPDGHIALLKDGADKLGEFNHWMGERTDKFKGAGTALEVVGGITTGVARGIVGMSEGGLRVVNYAANGLSMLAATATGQENSDWARAHMAEARQSNTTISNVGHYLMNGGVSDLASKAANTVDRAANGDASAISSVAEFATGFVSGGGAATKVSTLGAKASNAFKTTVAVSKGLLTDTAKTASKLTGETVNGIKSFGTSIMEGAGGRLNPLNYTTEGFGSLGGNIKYRPKGGAAATAESLNGGVKLHPDGSFRTADGKFASIVGEPAPGTTAAKQYAQFLRDNGMNVVGEEMVVKGPLGLRRYDIVVQDSAGKLHGIEIKSGTASKNSYQDFSDRFVNMFGAKGTGKLSGKTVNSAITIYVP